VAYIGSNVDDEIPIKIATLGFAYETYESEN